MNSPFASCSKYAKDGVHTLVVDFKGAKSNPALQQFRVLLESVQERVHKLCEEVAANIKGGGHMKSYNILNSTKSHSEKVSMKFNHGKLRFVTAAGEDIPEHSLNFRDYFVQPTACLQDVWIREQHFYPRLFAVACTVLPKQKEIEEIGNAIDFPDGILDAFEDVVHMDEE